jgi:hypothetical protein
MSLQPGAVSFRLQAMRDARAFGLGQLLVGAVALWSVSCSSSPGAEVAKSTPSTPSSERTLADRDAASPGKATLDAPTNDAGVALAASETKTAWGNDAGTEASTTAASEAEACFDYATSYCMRLVECDGSPPEVAASSCAHVGDLCPDLAFADGSTRSVETLVECAELFPSFDCEALLRGDFPDCITPGTRQAGDACVFASQCESLTCSSASIDECGECLRIAGPDDDCNEPLTSCPAMSECLEDGTCLNYQDAPASTDSAAPMAPSPAEDGQPCSMPADCSSYFCDQQVTPAVCRHQPLLGEDCKQTRACGDDGSYCELQGTVCSARPLEGEPCGTDAFTGQTLWCAIGLVCAQTSESEGSCVKLPAAGEPCFHLAFSTSEQGYCADGLECIESNGAELCSATGPTAPTGPAEPIAFGGDCSDAPDGCYPAASCVDGICQPSAMRGLFEAACTH